jgi:O-methyltransferase
MSSHPTIMKYGDVQIYQTQAEIDFLKECVKEVDRETIFGSFAEVGVFQGGSAKVIREISTRPLFLFDTFEGFADELDSSDSPSYFVGDCRAPEEIVKNLFKDDSVGNIHIIKGKFPESARGITDVQFKKFSFVHIDVDIYNATKNALEFFWPRMWSRGIMLIHDYPAHAGVKKAVDEFDFGQGFKKTKLFQRQLAIKKL